MEIFTRAEGARDRMSFSRRKTHLAAAFVAILSITGCEQPPTRSDASPAARIGEDLQLPVMIQTDAQSYPIGARVSMRLVNRTSRTVTCDLCASTLEQLGDEGPWRVIRESLAENCRSQWVTLGPGQATVNTFTAGPHIPAGRFRIRAMLIDTRGGPREEAISNIFTLTPQDY
jgi:hypothetical protein